MEVEIYCCLLVLVLGCSCTAEKEYKIRKEKESVTISCPHPVEGNVTWSRVFNGTKVDILTADNSTETKHIHDPEKYYSVTGDKSLHILKLIPSHKGIYLCNNQSVLHLSVIPFGKIQPVTTAKTSPTTAPSTPNTDRKPFLNLVLGIASTFLFLFLAIVIITVAFTRKCRRNKQGVKNPARPLAPSFLKTSTGGTVFMNPTYSNIVGPPPQTRNNSDIPLKQMAPPYSVIGHPILWRNQQRFATAAECNNNQYI
ncbi:hypothetical protein INR49_014665 [Caranx melampygus]|nr:hypothetical protein INR49_014665 [Caranx melampygus]